MKASTTRVAEANAQAVARYKEMRTALMDAPGIDRTLCEIVITSQLALLGHEVPFKLHAIRLFENQVSREQLEQVILAGLGVTFVIPQVAQALDWIEEAHRQHVHA
jgi:alkylhydroperoxidase/carboxymuconolactone decarboxylase family protein YurZ